MSPLEQPQLGESRAHIQLSLVLNPKHVCSAPLTLLDLLLGAQIVDTSDQRLVHLFDYCCPELPKAYIYEWDLWIIANNESSRPATLGITCYCQHLFCRVHYILG
jgi:hypothetical protein